MIALEGSKDRRIPGWLTTLMILAAHGGKVSGNSVAMASNLKYEALPRHQKKRKPNQSHC